MVVRPAINPTNKGVRTLIDFIRRPRSDDTQRTIYNLMTALRGPDNTTDDITRSFKAVTLTLRSYLGFAPEMAGGWTLDSYDRVMRSYSYKQFLIALERQLEQIKTSRTGIYPSHFPDHLSYAVECIGYTELLNFAIEYGKQNDLR